MVAISINKRLALERIGLRVLLVISEFGVRTRKNGSTVREELK